MRSNKLASLCLLASFGSVYPASSADNAKVELSIKPIACIVKQAGDVCTMTINVHWRAQRSINPCLYQESQKAFCWQDKSQATANVAINLKENMTFILKDDDNNIFAQQEVTVNASSSTQYRRRLRANWSLF